MHKSFASFSFGCRVNQAEKEEIDRKLLSRGYVWDETNPALYIVNTCSVTGKAEREAKQHVYQARKRYPSAKIVVTGCAATNWLKHGKKLSDADLLVDNLEKEYLVTIVLKRFAAGRQMTTMTPKSVRDKFLDSKRVIVKIQDGCQRYCTFCIVPYLRGLPKSRSIDSIVDSVKKWSRDMREVILTAINTQAFGYDTKERFVDLVKRTLTDTSISRLSFGSIHPWSIDEDFFRLYEEYKDNGRLVDFFHIPLQSGSDKILRLMKRGYTRDEFVEKLERIASLNPFAFIGTDIIVGFLEETEADFAETYEFLEKAPISKFHVFRYSPRENTAANYLRQRLTEPKSLDKQKRARALAKLSHEKYEKFLQKHIGHTFSTLLLQERKEEVQDGLLSNQVRIKVRVNPSEAGEMCRVRIEGYKEGSLFGTIV